MRVSQGTVSGSLLKCFVLADNVQIYYCQPNIEPKIELQTLLMTGNHQPEGIANSQVNH